MLHVIFMHFHNNFSLCSGRKVRRERYDALGEHWQRAAVDAAEHLLQPWVGGSTLLQHTRGEFCRASKTYGMPVCGNSLLFSTSLSSILCITTFSVSVTPKIALGQ